MGKRGPRPTPTAILKARGSWRAKENKSQPAPPTEQPDFPEWLTEEAAAAWHYVAPLLESMGVLARIDGNALARYCTLWARWRACEQKIATYGDVFPIKNEEGKVVGFVPTPYVGQSVKLCQLLARLEAEFGMTPSSRTRISAPQKKQDGEGDLAKILNFKVCS